MLLLILFANFLGLPESSDVESESCKTVEGSEIAAHSAARELSLITQLREETSLPTPTEQVNVKVSLESFLLSFC